MSEREDIERYGMEKYLRRLDKWLERRRERKENDEKHINEFTKQV